MGRNLWGEEEEEKKGRKLTKNELVERIVVSYSNFLKLLQICINK